MSEGQVTKKVTLVDPFSGRKVDGCPAPAVVLPVDWNKRPELGLELDTKTGNTKVVNTGDHDIDKEIQEFKDQCGFEGMLKLLRAGQATPHDFYDDGQHSGDSSMLPDNINDAFRAAQAANLDKDQMLSKLGVDEADGIDDTEAKIKAAVESYFKSLALQANKEVNKDETK